MKRSEINLAIRRMESFANERCFALPPFLAFTPEEWLDKGKEYDEIRDNMLGWDVTDYGMGNFPKVGFSLITLRNGSLANPKYQKGYAEKLLYLEETQYAPMHFHWSKMEDIINRGGGNVLITVYNADSDDSLSKSDVTVHIDGKESQVAAGSQIKLCPGESISIVQRMYHDFAVEGGTGPVLLGEVSMVNDDNSDNRFYESIGRFPEIEEDCEPYRLLCSEYPPAKS